MKVEKIIVSTEELEITGATLPSIEETEALPYSIRRYDAWWRLRSPGQQQKDAAVVLCDGSIFRLGYYVDNIYRIRPALKIENLKSSNLEIGDVFNFGGKKFKIISDSLAFCLEDIGCWYFRKDWRAEDANVYEKSDVKKFVDDWFGNASKVSKGENE